MFTGIRLNELYSLKTSDVQLGERRFFVRSGKGEKDRFVPPNENLVGHLKQYLQERDRRGRHCPFFIVSLKADRKLCEKLCCV